MFTRFMISKLSEAFREGRSKSFLDQSWGFLAMASPTQCSCTFLTLVQSQKFLTKFPLTTARNGDADSSRRESGRGAAPISSPQEARFRKPRAGPWNFGPRGAYPVGTQKLLVSHEFSAKRKDEVKRLLPLRGEASECELWTLNQCTIGQFVTK